MEVPLEFGPKTDEKVVCQVEKGFIWIETVTKSMVWKIHESHA